MSLALGGVLFFLAASLMLYVLLGGADLGAGVLEAAFGRRPADSERELVSHAMAPVWEANHIWLILAVVILFMGFPEVYTTITVYLHLPVIALLIGIVGRGTAFTFRHYDTTEGYRRTYSRIFAWSSVWMSLFLGILVGALMLGRVNPNASSFYDLYVATWLNRFCLLVGCFAAGCFAFIAAVYLTGETADPGLRAEFVRKAKQANVAIVLLGALVFLSAHLDGLPLITEFFTNALSVVCFVAATLLLIVIWRVIERPNLARAAGIVLLALVVLGWFAVQWPIAVKTVNGGISLISAAAPPATLKALLSALCVGSLLIFPSLFYLLLVFKRETFLLSPDSKLDARGAAMKAMVLKQIGPVETSPLVLCDLPDPQAKAGEIRIKVEACAVCRTDLHVIEGEIEQHKLPIVPGHQAVGIVDQLGEGVQGIEAGERAGIAWLRSTCGVCEFCESGRENLCRFSRYTGYDEDGGYAEHAVVRADYCYRLSDSIEPAYAAPLLCAGIVGYRALRLTGARPGERLGIFGFGSSAHVTMQIARAMGLEVFAATRAKEHQQLALRLGAVWAGPAEEAFPLPVQRAILFAPSGALVPRALETLERGGVLVLGGIYLGGIPELRYEKHLFHEKEIRSVEANTREDGRELFERWAEVLRPEISRYSLTDANLALQDFKAGRTSGTAVLVP